MRTIVGDYLGNIFEIETDDYSEWGINETDAIRFAQAGILPDDLRWIATKYGKPEPPLLFDNTQYIVTRFGYLPSQRHVVNLPKPQRRKRGRQP